MHLIRKRRALGWTQEQMATALGISRVTVVRIENGQQRPPGYLRHALKCFPECPPLADRSETHLFLLYAMERLNLTQRKLSKRLGCSPSYVTGILNGHERAQPYISFAVYALVHLHNQKECD